MMVLKRITACSVAIGLSLFAVGAASAGGLGFSMGPLLGQQSSAAIGNALNAHSSSGSPSSADDDMNGPTTAHVELGCIDAARFPDFVNVPPTPCANGKWPGS